MVKFLDQSADALSLNLIEGEIDKSQFDILAEGQLERHGVKLVAHIIGGSHFFTIDLGGGRRISEVFACTEVQTDLPRLYCGPLRGITKTIECSLFGNSQYVFEARTLEGEKAKLEIDEFSVQGDDLCLKFEFPSDDAEDSPVTLVCADMFVNDRNDVIVEVGTMHTYPNEGKVVFTDMCISISVEDKV